MRAPGSEQRDDAAATDVHQILGEQMRARVPDAGFAPEQRDVGRLAPRRREGAVEAHDVVVRVAAGRREEADAWALDARQREDVVVEQGVAPLHRESSSSERHDLRRPCAHACKRTGHRGHGHWPVVQTSRAKTRQRKGAVRVARQGRRAGVPRPSTSQARIASVPGSGRRAGWTSSCNGAAWRSSRPRQRCEGDGARSGREVEIELERLDPTRARCCQAGTEVVVDVEQDHLAEQGLDQLGQRASGVLGGDVGVAEVEAHADAARTAGGEPTPRSRPGRDRRASGCPGTPARGSRSLAARRRRSPSRSSGAASSPPRRAAHAAPAATHIPW